MPCSVEGAGTTPPSLCFFEAERQSSLLNDLGQMGCFRLREEPGPPQDL